MTLFVDKIIPYDLGAITTDLKKAEYILAVYKTSFEEILRNTSKTTVNPSVMFGSGEYIIALNLAWDLKSVNLGFINYKIDLDKYFDSFADCFSPKSVAAFHKIKEELKQKDLTKSKKIEFSDNDSDFVIAYGNYIEHHNRR